MSTRYACYLLNENHTLRWDAAGGYPTRDGPLRTQAESACEGYLAASSLTCKENRLLTHALINAQTINAVNAYSDNGSMHTSVMGKRAETEPSEFWRRLTEAWSVKGLPISQNGVATKLDKSQGSTRRWFTGDGYPEIETLREIAKLGDVTVDWLLLGTLPRSPIGPKTALGQFLQIWEKLDGHGKQILQSMAEALPTTKPHPERPTRAPLPHPKHPSS